MKIFQHTTYLLKPLSIVNRHLSLVTFFLSLSIPSISLAADKPDFTKTDQLTYRLYQEKKWDSLIIVGKQALRQHFDYYYLRVRMGIAFYERGQFITAINQFSSALEFNKTDPVALEYLYFCYINSNRTADAYSLVPSMSPEMKTHLKISPPVIEEVHVEGGANLTGAGGSNGKQTQAGLNAVYSEKDRYGNSYYGHADFTVNLWNKVSLNTAYNYLNFSKTKSFAWTTIEDRLVTKADCTWGYFNHYSFDTLRKDTSYKYRINQNEIFLEARIILDGGFRIMPSIHILNVRYPNLQARYYAQTVTDTLWKNTINNTEYTFPFKRTIYSITEIDTSFCNYVAGITFTRDFNLFTLGLFGSWSDLNGKNQAQAGWSLTYFPLGNLNLYENTTITGFFQGSDSRILLSQVLGGKITPWLWAEGTLLWGDYTNANISNGAIVFNNSDKIRYRVGANLIFILSGHIQLSLTYQYYRKEFQQLYYIMTTDTVSGNSVALPQTKLYPYSTNTIIGGITWKF
ncbi:MAG: hypothetical protein WCI71_01250 [Bacteroidota bacterium]